MLWWGSMWWGTEQKRDCRWPRKKISISTQSPLSYPTHNSTPQLVESSHTQNFLSQSNSHFSRVRRVESTQLEYCASLFFWYSHIFCDLMSSSNLHKNLANSHSSDPSQIIELDIGGVRYKTTRQTLLGDGKKPNFFTGLLNSGMDASLRDSTGTFNLFPRFSEHLIWILIQL